MSRHARKILLDECIDWRLSRHLKPHAVVTVAKAGWAGTTNGRLLKLAEGEFDVFITVDRNLSFQQNVTEFDIAVVVLCAASNRLQDLLLLIPRALEMLSSLEAGQVVSVS